MEYEGQICRAPMERSSFMLPVMVGCSYNKCKFCNLFRHLKYRELPIKQIENELIRVKKLGGALKKVFLGDGSAFDLPTEHLLNVLKLINFYFPQINEINMDATVSGILKKNETELETLYKNGVRHLYIGIESGLDDVLIFMKKDHNMEEAQKAVERIKQIGYFFDAHIMTGVCGKNKGKENVIALSEFFNKWQPSRIINFSMFLHSEVPLYQDIIKGKYEPKDELSNLKEEAYLIEKLKPKSNIHYEGFHDFIKIRVQGHLPKDKDKMLLFLNSKIAIYEKRQPIYAFVNGECTASTLINNDGKKVWGS